MLIKSLFDHASVIQDQLYTRAEFPTHFEILKISANKLIEGYSDLNDAESETLIRFSPEGFEIHPDAIADAVKFLRDNKTD